MSYEIWQKSFTHFSVMVFTQLKSYVIETSVNITVLMEDSRENDAVHMNGRKRGSTGNTRSEAP